MSASSARPAWSAPRCCASSRSAAFPVDELRGVRVAAVRGPAPPVRRRRGRRARCCATGCFDGLDLVIVDVDDPLALEWAPRGRGRGRAGRRQLGRVPHGARRAARGRRGQPRRPARPAARASRRARTARRWCSSPRSRRCTAPPGIERMVVSTYQSVSGAGQPGIAELDEQWTKVAGQAEELRRAATVDGLIAAGEVWAKPIAGNVIPLAGSVKEAGYTSEEWKLVHETRKILHDDRSRVTATCVRVPVYVGHACRRTCSSATDVAGRAVELLADAPGRRARRRRRRRAHAARGRGHRPGARRPAARGPVASRTRSTSGSPATTCARAPRSTPCRWPRC